MTFPASSWQKTLGTARGSVVMAALILVPLAFAITILGISAKVLFPGIQAEQALPFLMMNMLSPLRGAW